MTIRISHPHTPTRFIDLGPAHGERHPWNRMRRTIDDDRSAERLLRFAAAQSRTTNAPIEVHRER